MKSRIRLGRDSLNPYNFFGRFHGFSCIRSVYEVNGVLSFSDGDFDLPVWILDLPWWLILRSKLLHLKILSPLLQGYIVLLLKKYKKGEYMDSNQSKRGGSAKSPCQTPRSTDKSNRDLRTFDSNSNPVSKNEKEKGVNIQVIVRCRYIFENSFLAGR